MPTTDPTAPTKKVDPREIMGEHLLDRLATRITADHSHMGLEYSRRIMAETVKFLVAGVACDEPLSPSETVDVGWHTFILHTADYAEFCDRVAGYFIHHNPEYLDEKTRGGAKNVRQRTLDAITAAGFEADLPLWPEAADCHQCHAGCHGSPK
ncbi:glycine-rich domain-containing protein [Streptomyces sp. KLOTTS4A1]|uniref:glycine-rich domain-containing protein n=1 Tax=Streptomyces sp. KLOTTS4A1 TaxID=3390996 RepID=UPI0039F64073